MSKLAAVAERLAQTRRWLDQEADRLAARLDQLEKRAPAAIQTAHRILDEQLRDLDATEQMVQQWLSATAEVSGASGKSRTPQAGTSPLARPQPKQSNESVASTFEPARRLLDEQQKDVGKLERALQTLASELPEPQPDGAGQPTRAQSKPSNGGAPAPLNFRQLLDEQPSDEQHKDEGGLERALQTLATKLQGPPQSAAAGQLNRARLHQSNDEALEAARRLLDEPQKGEDGIKQPARKLGVVRVA